MGNIGEFEASLEIFNREYLRVSKENTKGEDK